jgi:hypothetical protein
MTHKNCGGKIELEDDAYRCQKCGRGYKCVGQEHYLDEVIENKPGEYKLSDFFKDLFKYAEYCERLPFQVHLARVQACIDQDGTMDLSKLKREGGV